MAVVGVAERRRHLRQAMDEARGLRRRRVRRRGRERVAQVRRRGRRAPAAHQQPGEREAGVDVVRLRRQELAQPALGAGDVAGLDVGRGGRDHGRTPDVGQLALQLGVIVDERGRVLERPHRGGDVAGGAEPARGRRHDRGAPGGVGQRGGVPEQRGGVHLRIRIGRGSRRDALERRQVRRRLGQELVDDRGGRRGVVADVLEHLGQPPPQRGDVLGRRRVAPRLGDPRPQDRRRLLAPPALGEDLGLIDEIADDVGRVGRRAGDDPRRRRIVAGLGQGARLRSQQRRRLEAAGGARRALAPDLGDVVPAPQLRQHVVEGAPGAEVVRPPRHDHAVDLGGALEVVVIAVQARGLVQRRHRPVLGRQPSHLLERLGGPVPRPDLAVQRGEPLVMVDVVGGPRDQRLHRRDRLHRLVEQLVGAGQLLEERGLHSRIVDAARDLLVQQRGQRRPQLLLGRDRTQPPARRDVVGVGPDDDERHPQVLERVRDRARALVPGVLVVGHRGAQSRPGTSPRAPPARGMWRRGGPTTPPPDAATRRCTPPRQSRATGERPRDGPRHRPVC
ncbi:MAG: hypothetical protein H6708_32380 [Kofleriaceae bacterium]|nr:hypothetical protein [Kofleriaceae bacterium]